MEEVDSIYFKEIKPTLEQRLGKYKNRMELIRTMIGIIVLVIQLLIVHNLFSK
jgi:hypothetical protein